MTETQLAYRKKGEEDNTSRGRSVVLPKDNAGITNILLAPFIFKHCKKYGILGCIRIISKSTRKVYSH
jgi:hypothetical protein